MTEKQKLSEIASVFFKLGSIAFGGPAVHIAMRKKRWWLNVNG